MVSCIQQRGNTLTSVARTLVECQKEFFEQGPGHLKPLRLLEDVYKRQVAIPAEEIIPENFNSAEALYDLIERLQDED